MPYNGFDITGKTAVVVGGTSGIGYTIAVGLAEAGADVVPTARRRELVEAAASEVEQRGRKSLRVISDVKDRSSLENVLAETLRTFGKIDILVNCAGRTKRAPTIDYPETEWTDILETNLTGALRSCQVFGAEMLKRGRGKIINITSLGSFVALFEVAAYCASKAALASLTKSLAVEWGRYGININAITPGVFRTALTEQLLDDTERGREFLLRTPMERFGRVEELVGAAIFLSSEAADFVNGEVLVVDGGFLASGVNH